MKKLLAGFVLLMALLAGCSSGSDYEINLKEAPKYKAGETYPVVIEILQDGEPAAGLDFAAYLEMAKMDHGTIELDFEDKGNGVYESSVELPMAGEWIANIEGEADGSAFEHVITFEVEKE
ncbi:FixH family protein [Bacillus sp. ISL-41]|uniref:FixH family protein n=1 Tax=Bacillus sp. ISL-41 TaxID=2819127 RepID=UPI001BEB7C76|nr:FixH family protein [Bacillus sp. ISL-41]MBT2645095.1 FixH family protein [Bacillus sp. ISL-41]